MDVQIFEHFYRVYTRIYRNEKLIELPAMTAVTPI